MKRWSSKKHDHIEDPKVDAFLSEVVEVCRRHGMSISHEDGNGAFIVNAFNQRDAKWLMDATSEMEATDA